jgi:acyl-CoA thioester hydrolase
MKRLFFIEDRVIFGDTDAMGVVYHANYLRWFERGRTELLREINFVYTELEKYPVWLPLTHADLHFIKPARYDDPLVVCSQIVELGFATMLLNYEISHKETGELLVTGSTRHAITDNNLKPIKLKKVYPEFYAALKAISADSE